MSNLDMLKKQHEEVLALMKTITVLIADHPEEKSKEIAFNINALSGKLKMHLMSEDQFLYPSLMQSGNSLMQSGNQTIRNTAQTFNHEMGNLAELFRSFAQKYNTPSKIIQDKIHFITESQKIFQLIEERIKNEDVKLYPLIAAK